MTLADQILDKTSDLPPAPIAACKLMDLLKHPSRDNVDEVAQTIQYDPSLTARLLRCANSVYMGGRDPVGSVEQAVLRLGYWEIMRLVLTLSVGNSLGRELQAYGVNSVELWYHSINVAVASQKLAEFSKTPTEEPSVAFTAGLLHDIGKVVLDRCLPQHLIRDRVRRGGLSLTEAEAAVMGVNHAEIGGRLLARWKLPDPIVQAVAHHHQPQRGVLSAVVHLADCCVHVLGASYGWASFATRSQAGISETLGLTQNDVERTIIHVQGESHRIKEFMSIV
ncbi:MAG: HDOD domain-containing protein [Verrucomicrobia bacterium]|nr:HDOD domain-containing protein [Verrucomicrobiota bacterium]